MKTRIILQDNLWFRGRPHFSNYRKGGKPMIRLAPRLGLTWSNDAAAKRKELAWLKEYTGAQGKNLVIAQEWIKKNDYIDSNLRDVWLPVFERRAQQGKWCVFYDPILAARQRGLIDGDEGFVDFSRPRVLEMWKKDIRHLQKRYFGHSQYWRLRGGHPVLYVWAAFALRNTDKAYAFARNRMIYLLADVLGTSVRPPMVNGLTGFTAAMTGIERRFYRLPELMPRYQEAYLDALGSDDHDVIPAGSCGFDDALFVKNTNRPLDPMWIVPRNKREIEDFLELALAHALPIGDTRYIFWGTMNNWAEGATVLPTKKKGPAFPANRVGNYGFAYLQAIRNVLARSGA